MSKRKSLRTRVHLTERALRDILEIEAYSVEQFGRRAASRYLADLEAALGRIAEHPDLLRQESQFHPALQFYRAGSHLLVCDRQDMGIFVLTLLHGSMDIPERLHELEPTLQVETEILHRKLRQSRRT